MGVGTWQIAPDSRRVYFMTPDTIDADDKARRDAKFTVNIRNMETPLASLWAVDLEPLKVTRLTNDATITVASGCLQKKVSASANGDVVLCVLCVLCGSTVLPQRTQRTQRTSARSRSAKSVWCARKQRLRAQRACRPAVRFTMPAKHTARLELAR